MTAFGGNRFELPENWSPEGVWCVTVNIPADMEYLDVLIGLIDELKWSKNFGRDPTRAGAATVSRTWQAALESVPVRVIDCEGGGMSFDLRVKPGQPWVMQASTDGGVTWHDALIQPHWETASVNPNTADFTEAKQQAGRIVRGWHEWAAQSFLDAIEAGVPKEAMLNQMMGEIAPYTTNPTATRNGLSAAFDAFTDLPTPTAEAFATDCVYRATWQGLVDKLVDHAMNWGDDLTTVLEQPPDDLGTMDATERLLNFSAAGMSANDVYNFVNRKLQEGSEFMYDCIWEYEWNFTTGDGGWNTAPSGNPDIPIAVYEEGVGFHDDGPNEGGCAVAVRIELLDTNQPALYTYMAVKLAMQASPDNGIGVGTFNPSCGATSGGGSEPDPVWVEFDLEAVPCVEYATGLYAEQFNTTCHNILVVGVKVRGRTYNPFV